MRGKPYFFNSLNGLFGFGRIWDKTAGENDPSLHNKKEAAISKIKKKSPSSDFYKKLQNGS
jgi:hypothetical protein